MIMPRSAPQQQQLPAPLRLCTHNVHGFSSPSSKAAALLRLWRQMRMDILLLQETHTTMFQGAKIDRLFHNHYDLVWHHGTDNSRGVAIAIRSALLASGAVKLGEPVRAGRTTGEGLAGRLLALPIDWAGHRLLLVNAYLPNDSTRQRRFIMELLQTCCAGAGSRSIVLGGDFNFVESPPLDRMQRLRSTPHQVQWAPATHPDSNTARLMRDQLPDLCDVFRHIHRERRALTHITSRTGSRIDRWYVSEQLLSYVPTADVTDTTLSDHRPVHISLTPRRPLRTGRGLRRVRADFLKLPAIKDQFVAFCEQQLSTAPQDDLALLVWYDTFKRSVKRKAMALRREARLLELQLSGEEQLARADLQAAHSAIEVGQEDALQAALDARQRFIAAAMAANDKQYLRSRHDWIHCQERPCPAITKIMSSPKDDTSIPALRDDAGRMITDPRQLPQLVADFWAGVSSQQPSCAAAEAQVLAALLQHAQPITPEEADSLGCATVDIAEVAKAMKDAPSGRSPGPDGLPVEVYRKLKSLFCPLFQALFSAIGRTGQLPRCFLLGAITTIYKKGSRADRSNYRPITLLNSDYRLLTKVLANRLGPCLQKHISKEQTAFLPGRRIGENIHLLQTLPLYLHHMHKSALVVFCDFRKAYDTISRPFLLRVMQAMGVGHGFLTWVRSLYTNTSTMAVVNGFVSRPVQFTAGVRQGCPLAPLLYLFLAQALLCWLRYKDVGIRFQDGSQLTACQYADDTEAIVESPAHIPAFLSAMDTFRQASGQALNLDKCEVLPIGRIPSGAAGHQWRVPHMHGLRVVQHATALGVTFTNNVPGSGQPEAPSADWSKLAAGVQGAYSKVLRLGLSIFGRAFACSGYGIAKLLYHAEHAGRIPDDTLEQLHEHTRMVVDCQRLAGVESTCPPGPDPRLLPGHPGKEGGFGMLPWREHILARHAVWGSSLIKASLQPTDMQPPWVKVAMALLAEQTDFTALPHPFFMLCRTTPWQAPGVMLQRLMGGLLALPPIADLQPELPPVGDWCFAAPLWGNPALTKARLAAGLGPASVDELFAGRQLATRPPALRTVGDAVKEVRSPFYTAWKPLVQRLVSLLPPSWVTAAHAAADKVERGLIATPQLPAALEVLLPRLGWRLERRAQPVTLYNLTVKLATRLQLQPLRQLRHQCRLAFAAEALETTQPAAVPASIIDHVSNLLRELWALQWDNNNKEIFWRLQSDGLPKFNGHCVCGAPHTNRAHVFWDCAVAQAVVAHIAAQLPQNTHLSRQQLWLMLPPPGVHKPVWHVVCLAALSAMDHGHRQLYRLRKQRTQELRDLLAEQQHQRQQRQQNDAAWQRMGLHIQQSPEDQQQDQHAADLLSPEQRQQLLDACGGLATAFFWERLIDFVYLDTLPEPEHLGADHAFIYRDGQRLRVRRPA